MPDHEFAYPTVVEIVRPPSAADGDRDFFPTETPSSRRHDDTHCAGACKEYTPGSWDPAGAVRLTRSAVSARSSGAAASGRSSNSCSGELRPSSMGDPNALDEH
jgi:hypothetical protein